MMFLEYTAWHCATGRLMIFRHPKSVSQIVITIKNHYKQWTAWWFGTFFHILGMSSSQLTSIFFKIVKTTNQKMTDFSHWICECPLFGQGSTTDTMPKTLKELVLVYLNPKP